MIFLPLYGFFFIVISNHRLGFFANVMKVHAALLLCIMYSAPTIWHLWQHPDHFHIQQQNHHHHQLNQLIFIWFFLKNLVIITKYVTNITNTQRLWLNHFFRNFFAPAPQKRSVAQTIQSYWSFRPGCIKRSWFIFIWCGITCHT